MSDGAGPGAAPACRVGVRAAESPGQAPCCVAVPWAPVLWSHLVGIGICRPPVQPSLKVKEPGAGGSVTFPSSPSNQMGRAQCRGKTRALGTHGTGLKPESWLLAAWTLRWVRLCASISSSVDLAHYLMCTKFLFARDSCL